MTKKKDENKRVKSCSEGTDCSASDLKDPAALMSLDNALPNHIRALINYKRLPATIKRRIKALKKLQHESFKVEVDFQKEIHALEQKYAAQFNPIFDKRREILTGSVEPTDEDCQWASDVDEDEEKLAKDLAVKLNIAPDNAGDKPQADTTTSAVSVPTSVDSDAKGIPNFWLTVFQNCDLLNNLIQPHDIELLKHLTDVRVSNLFEADTPVGKPGFRLHLHFTPNDYFTDAELTKDYFLRFELASDDPLEYEGPEIIQCRGCTIHWNKDKNLTVKVIKKQQKHKKGGKRTVFKTVPADSFFNFFAPIEDCLHQPGVDMDEDTEALLESDFEIGQYIRLHVIPRAVLLYTGEGLQDEYDDEDDDDDLDDDEEEEEDEEESELSDDEDAKPTSKNRGGGIAKGGNRGGRGGGRGGGTSGRGGGNKPPVAGGTGEQAGKEKEECKQQ